MSSIVINDPKAPNRWHRGVFRKRDDGVAEGIGYMAVLVSLGKAKVTSVTFNADDGTTIHFANDSTPEHWVKEISKIF